MPKPVALILLNWNTPGHSVNCIGSLLKYCNQDLFDIIVADNGSTDNSLAVIRATYPNLIYIENKQNLGFAEGNNRALRYSLSNNYLYSLLINTDTVVDEDMVGKLYKHLEQYSEAAAVQPAIYWMHDKANIWNGKGKFNKATGMIYSDKTKPAGSHVRAFECADWLTGCCVLLRNECLKESGLFNSKFFLYYEDVDLSLRLRDTGRQLHYLPSAKMYHEAGVSAKVEKPENEGSLSPIIHYYITRNRLWFLRRYGSPFFLPLYVLTALVYYPAIWLYFKLRGRDKKAKFVLQGLKEGLFEPKENIWADLN